MKTIRAHLRLSTNIDGQARDRCPDVVFTAHGSEIVAIRTDVQMAQLPLADSSVSIFVIDDDALSRSIDEEAWLQEFARVLAPGGLLQLTLPAEGRLAWLDTMNAYRYFADVSGRGNSPHAAFPTGWNRHYRREEIGKLFEGTGLVVESIHPQNHAASEVGFLASMVWHNWIRKDKTAELTLFPRFGGRAPGKRSILPTTWSVSARKS